MKISLWRISVIIQVAWAIYILMAFSFQKHLTKEDTSTSYRSPLVLSKLLYSNQDSTKNTKLQAAYAKDDLAIFYNVYIPNNNIKNALRIIEEQLASRASSPTLSNVTLYYTHIGALNVTFPSCNNCVLLNAVSEGDEVLTLQALHDYCAVNPSGRAVYIHSKVS